MYQSKASLMLRAIQIILVYDLQNYGIWEKLIWTSMQLHYNYAKTFESKRLNIGYLEKELERCARRETFETSLY